MMMYYLVTIVIVALDIVTIVIVTIIIVALDIAHCCHGKTNITYFYVHNSTHIYVNVLTYSTKEFMTCK